MSLAVSALSASGTPVLSAQGSGTAATLERAAAPRSRAFFVFGLPPIAASGTLGLSVAISRARPVIVPSYTKADGSKAPVYIAEKWRTRTLQRTTSGLTFTRTFLIHGSKDPAEVVNVGPQVGDYDDVLTAFFVTDRKDTIYAAGKDSGADGDADIIEAVVTYTLPGPQFSQTQQATISYDFASESEHVDKAIDQASYNPEGDATDIGDLINVSTEGVQGLDINAPIIEFSEEHYFSQTVFSPSFRRTLADAVMKTNAAPFRDWAAGEVLFVGARAVKQGVQVYVTYQFRVRRNKTGIVFTLYSLDGKTQKDFKVDKAGWAYLWIDSAKNRNAATGKVTVVPHGVHVAQVYDQVDFAVLGIGTDPIT